MVKPKVKSMAASKLPSSAVKSKATPTFKKSKKFTKRVGTQGLNAQKKSTQAVNTGKQLHTLRESKEGEKSIASPKLPTKKKPANKAGVKRKKDDNQGELRPRTCPIIRCWCNISTKHLAFVLGFFLLRLLPLDLI